MLNMISNSINAKSDDGTECFETSQTSSTTLSGSVASQIHLALEALLISNNNVLDDEYKKKLIDAGFKLPKESRHMKSKSTDYSVNMEIEFDPAVSNEPDDLARSVDIAETFCFKPLGVQTWTEIPFQSDTSTTKEALLDLMLNFVGQSNLPNDVDYFVPSLVSVDLTANHDDIKAHAEQYQSLFQLPQDHKIQKTFVACIIKSMKDDSFFIVGLKRREEAFGGFSYQVGVITLKEPSQGIIESIKCFFESLVNSCSLFLKGCKAEFLSADLFSERAKNLHAMIQVDLSNVNDNVMKLSWVALSYIAVKCMRTSARGKRAQKSVKFMRLEPIFEELDKIHDKHDLLCELIAPWFWSSIIIAVELELVELSVVDKADPSLTRPLTQKQLAEVKNKISVQYSDSILNYQSKLAVLPVIFFLLCDISCLL